MVAANAAVGGYHANFNGAVARKWLENRYIPYIKAVDAAVMSGAPGARLERGLGHALRADGAHYHVSSSPNLVTPAATCAATRAGCPRRTS